jgi:hypothetical protein
MTATIQAQDTTRPTPIVLPALSLAAYQQLTEALVYDLRHVLGAEARIRRGAGDLHTRRILATDEVGVYLIESSVSGQFYRATTFRCTCPDAMQREVQCRHSYALILLHAATDEARYQRLTARYTLTSKGLAATQAPEPVIVA